jgi:hypothetical protein
MDPMRLSIKMPTAIASPASHCLALIARRLTPEAMLLPLSRLVSLRLQLMQSNSTIPCWNVPELKNALIEEN